MVLKEVILSLSGGVLKQVVTALAWKSLSSMENRIVERDETR